MFPPTARPSAAPIGTMHPSRSRGIPLGPSLAVQRGLQAQRYRAPRSPASMWPGTSGPLRATWGLRGLWLSAMPPIICPGGEGAGWLREIDPLYMSLADAEKDQITPPANHGLQHGQAPLSIPHPWSLAKIICREKTSSLVLPDFKIVTSTLKPFLIRVKTRTIVLWLGPTWCQPTGPPKLTRG